MSEEYKQKEKDKANKCFWDELCGTALAKSLGISDHTKNSLKRFDRAYMDFYPYLLKYVKPEDMRAKKVLEIGIGYGTLGHILAENTKWYQGLDIATSPVKMMNHRLQMNDLNGSAVQGSALKMPFADDTFDHVVSIGCFHHTGNAEQCVRETHRVLRSGGRVVVMLYNRYSFRQWVRWPVRTAKALLGETILHKNKGSSSTKTQRKAYDAGLNGNAAPETEFLTNKQILKIFSCFSELRITKENCDHLGCRPLGIFIDRKKILPYVGRFAGLDYYITAIKK